jgi:hypothetical protein
MKKIAIGLIFVSICNCYPVENSVFSLTQEIDRFIKSEQFKISIKNQEKDFWLKLLTDIPAHPAMLRVMPLSKGVLTNTFLWIIRSNMDWTLLQKMKLEEARIELFNIEKNYKGQENKLRYDQAYLEKKVKYEKTIEYYNKNSPQGIQQEIKFIALKEAVNKLSEAITKYELPDKA